MSSIRRERIRKLGRIRFILLFGVCGWGFLFGLAFTVPFGLPAIFLVRWFSGHWEASSVWLGFGIPMLLSAIGGFQWGSRMWEVLFESSSHPSA